SLPDGTLWPEEVVEVKPLGTDSGQIVWTWKLWDHLVQDFDSTKLNYGVVADHPELLDINYLKGNIQAGNAGRDWLHANAVDYNAQLDQIMISSRVMCEVYIIDHST